jgi:hypothetical protein
MGEWRSKFVIRDLGTEWRWVVSFTPRPLFSQGNSHRYSLNKRPFIKCFLLIVIIATKLGTHPSPYMRCASTPLGLHSWPSTWLDPGLKSYGGWGWTYLLLWIYRVIQEELLPLTELISDDILSRKYHINLGPIHNIYRVTFVFGNGLLWTARGLR